MYISLLRLVENKNFLGKLCLRVGLGGEGESGTFSIKLGQISLILYQYVQRSKHYEHEQYSKRCCIR